MHGGEVDPVARCAELRHETYAARFELLLHVALQQVERLFRAGADTKVFAAAGRIAQIVPKHLRAVAPQPLWGHLLSGERADDRQPAARARHGHVQAPLAALLGQGAELIAHPAVGGLAVAGGQDDRVALISLHALEVLHKRRFVLVLRKEFLKLWVLAAGEAQRLRDRVRVPDAESDHAERLAGAAAGMLHHEIDDSPDLGRT